MHPPCIQNLSTIIYKDWKLLLYLITSIGISTAGGGGQFIFNQLAYQLLLQLMKIYT